MSPRPSSPNVLVVDDDRIMGELLVALLTLRGYAVEHVHSGDEALQHIRHHGAQLDIILCDIHMPGLCSAELVSALTAAREQGTLPAETLLLGMSGSAPDAAEAQLFDTFLHKPFTVEDFTAAAERARAQSKPSHATSEPENSAPRHTPPASTPQQTTPSTAPPLEERTFSQLRSKLPDDQLRQLYEMILTDVRQRLEHMAAAAHSGDETAVRNQAHAIKGGCGMVGALELQQLASATEGGSALDTSALADFAAACQRLQRMLDERL